MLPRGPSRCISRGRSLRRLSFAAYTKGGDAPWVADSGGFAYSGAIDDDEESWMYLDVQGPGTVKFKWKVSSQQYCDYLEFYTDGNCRESVSGEVSWTAKSFTVTGSGSHRLKWRYVKDSNDYSGDDRGYVKDVNFTPPPLPPPDALAEAVDSGLTFTTGGDNGGWYTESGSSCYHDWDQATGSTCNDGTDWMQTTVAGTGTIKFWWKVSSEGTCDYLEFYIDGQQQDAISGEVGWTQKTFTISGGGTHTLKWQYAKSSTGSAGQDRGWVDWVQWNGTTTEPATTAWSTLNHAYDASGRRIEKKYDGRAVLKYIYDGDHCIAEYGAGNDLHRKYVYGPRVDQPISMIESSGSYAGTYYYHFDGLGSVVALTNASGNTVQVYDYSVYGQVGATDASHPNRLMFTAREFDKETGLYYYRARYYKPEIGRFLQPDKVGYSAGMNLYRYCMNNPSNKVDPLGQEPCSPTYVASIDYDDIMDPCNSCIETLKKRLDYLTKNRLGGCIGDAGGVFSEQVIAGIAACSGALLGGVWTYSACVAGVIGEAAIVDTAVFAACRSTWNRDVNDAYQHYNFCMCKKNKEGTTAECAKRYISDPCAPAWARWFSSI